MKTVFRINDRGHWRDFDESDFPVAVTITGQSEISVGDAAEASPDAWLGFDAERKLVFIQPSIQINDDLLAVSGWLSAGDRVRIAGRYFSVGRDDSVLVLGPAAYSEGAMAETPSENSGLSEPTASPASGAEPREPFEELTAVAPFSNKESRAFRHVMGGIFLLLLAGVFFVLAAVPVKIAISPTPDASSMSGLLPAIKIGERHLALPATYWVRADKAGYRELASALDVDFGPEVTVTYQMQKLPGLLDVISPPVEGAEVRIDGKVVGRTPLAAFEIEAGTHELQVLADRYLPHKETIEIKGMGQRRSLTIDLLPGWGSLQISSEPQDAEVWLDGKVMGKTPLRLEPMAGEYRIELRKEGWKKMLAKVQVEAGKPVDLPVLRLVKVDCVLNLTSNPPGAQITFDDRYVGPTPISLELVAGAEHRLTAAKAGYAAVSRTVRVEREAVQNLNLDLEPEFGIVFISSKPADAQLKVDGKIVGSASRRLRLPTRAHEIEISKPGYEAYSTSVTPDRKNSIKLDVRLKLAKPSE